MWRLTPKEFQAVAALDGARRVDHAVKRMADTKQVWLLREGELWKVSKLDDGTEAILVWPHRLYAESCTTGAWSGARAAAVDVRDFIEKWLHGMEKDRRMVAVFPVDKDKAVVLTPSAFRRMLESELAKY